MRIDAPHVAEQITRYLHHDLSSAELVDWAENAMMDAEFVGPNADAVRDVAARLGLADVRAFGLTWEDCEALLQKLGYSVHVDVRGG